MSKNRVRVLVVVLAASSASACATRAFVAKKLDERVAKVEGRVSAVERSIEETTDGTRANSARLGEVDKTSTMALDEATSARHSVREARNAASGALAKAVALESASRRLLFEIVIAEDHDQFGFADAALPEPATSSLDALVDRLRAQPGSVHLEIAGHTDSTGPAWFNDKLGLERAESVRRYLYERHGLPLHKINVISCRSRPTTRRPVGR